MSFSRSVLIGCLLLGLVSAASAQIVFDEDIKGADELVSWRAEAQPDVIGPSGSSVVTIRGTIDPAWKMYALDSEIPEGSGLGRPIGVTIEWSNLPTGLSVLPDIGQSPPIRKFDSIFRMDVAWFEKDVRFYSALTGSDSLASGPATPTVNVRFQICNDERGICLPPTVMPVPVSLRVDPDCSNCTASGAELAKTRDTGMGDEVSGSLLTSDLNGYRKGGLMSFLLLAVGAGLLSLLTPCVFPMIPLTVSYFTKHADNRAESFRMALIYGAAIVVLFTGIGIVMAMLVGAAGAQTIASNPWVNLMIAGVLVVFALSLLGLFELRLPSGFLTRVHERGGRGGIVGVLFMGLTLTLVSFSCTAPFVGGLLAAASGGTWVFPLFGMIAYSATFAIPFVFFALFPNALATLPQSGAWMNTLKVVLGFVELAAAVKFLSNADLVWGWNLMSRPLGIAFVLVVFTLTGLYLLGKLRLPHEPPVEAIGVGRLFSATAFFVVSLYLFPGLLGAPLNALDAYLPPRKGTDVSILNFMASAQGRQQAAAMDESAWHVDDIDAAFAEARERSLPVFVDFTGWSCTNCRDMEANVFPDAEVVRRFEDDFVLLRLYTDGLEKGGDYQRFQLQLTGTVALPTYAVVSPDDESLIARRSGTMKIPVFVEFLDRGIAGYSVPSPAVAGL